MQRGHGDHVLGDRGEVRAVLMVIVRLVAVDPVPAAAAPADVLLLQLELVAVDALAHPRHRGAVQLVPRDSGNVHVQERAVREWALVHRGHQPGDEAGSALEVELPAQPEVHLALARLLRDRDRRQAEHDSLQRGGDGAGIGDVVAQVGAVVDPRHDQLRLEADQPEGGEPHAIDGGPVGRVTHAAVLEVDLLHPQRRPGGDAAGAGGAVRVGRDHRQLDVGHRQQRAPHLVQALRGDAVVVGEQDFHGEQG